MCWMSRRLSHTTVPRSLHVPNITSCMYMQDLFLLIIHPDAQILKRPVYVQYTTGCSMFKSPVYQCLPPYRQIPNAPNAPSPFFIFADPKRLTLNMLTAQTPLCLQS